MTSRPKFSNHAGWNCVFDANEAAFCRENRAADRALIWVSAALIPRKPPFAAGHDRLFHRVAAVVACDRLAVIIR